MPNERFAVEAIKYQEYPNLAIDRRPQLERLQRNLNDSRNTAVIGPFYSGKSSLCVTAAESSGYIYYRAPMNDFREPTEFPEHIEYLLKKFGPKNVGFPKLIILDEMRPLSSAGRSTPVVEYINAHPNTVWIMISQEAVNSELMTVIQDTIELEFIPEELRPIVNKSKR